MTIETTIKGGLRVLASCLIAPRTYGADHPFDSIEDLHFHTIPADPWETPPEYNADVSEEDIERVCNELMEARLDQGES